MWCLLVPKWWGVPIFHSPSNKPLWWGEYADTRWSHRGMPRQENRKPFVDVRDKLYPPDSHGDFGMFCSSKSYLDMTYTRHRQVQDSTSDIKWWSYLAIMKQKIHHHSMILMCFLIYWKSKKVLHKQNSIQLPFDNILQLTNLTNVPSTDHHAEDLPWIFHVENAMATASDNWLYYTSLGRLSNTNPR